jgi:dihydroorotase
LTDAEIASYDARFKVNPPLRPDEHVEAVIAGLLDGTIDAIATDHAPHTPESKDLPFDEAPPGMLGLETAFSLAYERLVEGAGCSIEHLFDLLSTNPARIAHLDEAGARPYGHTPHGGPVRVGMVANLVAVDPAARWTVEGTSLASLATNTPYEGRTMHGRVRHTVLRGDAVVRSGEVQR